MKDGNSKPVHFLKIGLLDRKILCQVYSIAGGIGLVITILSPFIKLPWWFLIIVICLIVGIYLVIYLNANKMEVRTFKINGTHVVIKYGDIFAEKNSLKIIAFNEYFDTVVNDELISPNTINGKYLKQIETRISELDSALVKDAHLQKCVLSTHDSRPTGKKTQYKLGSTFKYDDCLLVAFSRFDEENHAYLSVDDYVACILNMWQEIGMQYNGSSITLPLLGSGITRIGSIKFIPYMELLEILLWTLEKSKIHLAYGCNIQIILSDTEHVRKNMNLFSVNGPV